MTCEKYGDHFIAQLNIVHSSAVTLLVLCSEQHGQQVLLPFSVTASFIDHSIDKRVHVTSRAFELAVCRQRQAIQESRERQHEAGEWPHTVGDSSTHLLRF